MNNMKQVKNLTAILIVLIFGLSSCQQVQTVTPTTASRMQQRNWRITLFNDNNVDETSHFSGYAITFNSNGSVSAVKEGLTIYGIWSIGNDDDSQKQLVLNFGETVPFDELSDDWNILEETDTKIRLEDVSNGNGGTEFLTIERN